MALVDYSDSSESDSANIPNVKTTSNTLKSTFQKVVDRSNPGKIRVSLPQPSSKQTNDDEPPTKRIKTGGGGFGGFNSFLPPPKHVGQASTVTLGGGSKARSGSLPAGLSLKTGAAPGFSREPELEYGNREALNEESDLPSQSAAVDGFTPPPSTTSNFADDKPHPEAKVLGKPPMFKPLSVSKNSAKKKKKAEVPITTRTSTNQPSLSAGEETHSKRQKISLFSVSTELNEFSSGSIPQKEYEPILYGGSTENHPSEITLDSQMGSIYGEYPQTSQYTVPPSTAPKTEAQSLKDIASDLHLSPAERRQLFGRQKGRRSGEIPSATSVINFNTDEEYRHNEELRAAGEQIVHNPVRSIAPGKHSLKQLVNAASSQREALEESFAKGRNNRAEASSRYGW